MFANKQSLTRKKERLDCNFVEKAVLMTNFKANNFPTLILEADKWNFRFENKLCWLFPLLPLGDCVHEICSRTALHKKVFSPILIYYSHQLTRVFGVSRSGPIPFRLRFLKVDIFLALNVAVWLQFVEFRRYRIDLNSALWQFMTPVFQAYFSIARQTLHINTILGQ